MFSRNLSKLFVLVLAVALFLVLNDGQAFAQGTKPPYQKQGKITPADRQAAAKNLVRTLAAKGIAVRPNTKLRSPAAGCTYNAPQPSVLCLPDYFGTIPNFANSPLPPSVSIFGDGNGWAQFTVNLSGNTVSGFNMINGGSGYTTASVNVIGGGGSGATGTPVIVNGGIPYINLVTGGSGYTAPTATILGGSTVTTTATATVTVSAGVITGVQILNGGAGYITATVQINDSTGLGAVANAVVANGVISSIAVATPGAGYGTVPGIRKFVDTMPGLLISGTVTTTVANNLGNYIPVAAPDTTTFPGSDYYEIEVGMYTEKMHSDLPATKLEGYRQTNAVDPNLKKFSYLGPIIISSKDRPVRITFKNSLPNGTAGNLFIPVDTSVMGAGVGPQDSTGASCDPAIQTTCAWYTQNRNTVHLHGGTTPWISDGTPHQWTAPAGESTVYKKGVSVGYVPDMWYDASGNLIKSCAGQMTCATAGSSINPGAGKLTFYYDNQQSARLLFYHDHALGLTRLNVYVGQAAGYLVTDPVEQTLVNGGVITDTANVPHAVAAGTIPAAQLPLVIEDKTFVPDVATQLAAQDPTWDVSKYGGYGNLWFPHVYMPNQNPWDPSGANAMGRWDYGPWFWPPWTPLKYGEIANPLYPGTPGEPPLIPGITNPSNTPEAFMDTMTVNGVAYPYVKLGAKAYRFRILSVGNDRTLNLQWYFAKSNAQMWNANGTLNDANAGEVNMVPAVPNAGLPPNWPTDGRDGGVPDPKAAGPSWIEIGTEGGFLPAVNVIPPLPINYEYNRRSVTVLNVSTHSLLLGPAERADVIVDFSGIVSGTKLILYNDAPAPVPGLDPRLDYYTGDPDFTSTGGAPMTLPGYGPNTRTIMQVQIDTSLGNDPTFNLAALQAALPVAYSMVQPPPIVPEPEYAKAFSMTVPTGNYARIQDTSMSFFNGALSGATVTASGSGYNITPTVSFVGGGGTGASATAIIARTVQTLTVTNAGSGFTSVPTVTIVAVNGQGSGATATATLAGTGVGSVTVTNGGTGSCLSRPTVTFSGGGGSGATATATVVSRRVTSITVTAAGSGYTSPPTVTVSGGGCSGVTAVSVLSPTGIGSLTLTNPGSGYTVNPNVNIQGGGGNGAQASAQLGGGIVIGLANFVGGSGYTSAPTIVFTPVSGGSGATAVALGTTLNNEPKTIQELFTNDYGKMNSTLGTEIPRTNNLVQTTLPMAYVDPPTEIVTNSLSSAPIGSASDGSQIWKITHNGVDTHFIHWHMFDVQVINRVGWDGAVKPPDANEMGWKDTVRMNPLEDIIVAVRAIEPTLPASWNGLPNSIRPMDPTIPLGAAGEFTGVDPTGQGAPVTNQLINYGWEYVWHCHILGHEENDMMRAVIFGLPPNQVASVTAVKQGSSTLQRAVLTWQNNSRNATGFIIQRASSTSGPWTQVNSTPMPAPAYGVNATYTDTTIPRGKTSYYRIIAINTVGDTTVYAAPAAGYPSATFSAQPSPASNGVTTN